MVKNQLANAEDPGHMGLVPGSGIFPWRREDNPFQYSRLGNPTDRGVLWAIVHGVARESDFTDN